MRARSLSIWREQVSHKSKNHSVCEGALGSSIATHHCSALVAEGTPKACDMPARSERNVFKALRSSQLQNAFDDDFLLKHQHLVVDA
jgi:hypothetical protein